MSSGRRPCRCRPAVARADVVRPSPVPAKITLTALDLEVRATDRCARPPRERHGRWNPALGVTMNSIEGSIGRAAFDVARHARSAAPSA